MNINKRLVNKNFHLTQEVVLWDFFPVKNEDNLLLTFESKNSYWLQGVWLMCDQGIEINGVFNRSFTIWFETAPHIVRLKCFSITGGVNLYNVWDRGMGCNSQSHTSGMLVKEIPNGRRYYCNDIGLESNFDKLVFSLVFDDCA